MVSRTPTKAPPSPRLAGVGGTVTPSKPKPPSPVARRQHALRRQSPAITKRRGSPLKSLATVAAAAATFDLSILSCRRRLLDVLDVAAAAGFQRPRPTSAPATPPPPPSQNRAHSAALPPPLSPGRPTLFLDLDDTLIHSQKDTPPPRFDFIVRPVVKGKTLTYYITKRPCVDEFLRAAAERFEVVVFTAALPEYANPVLDRLDPDGEVFAHRLYRGACLDAGDQTFVKDLAATGRPLDRAVIVDDDPDAYALQPENAIPVASFEGDDNDEELQWVMALLDITAEYEDMREFTRYYQHLLTLI
ncbi:hypothetical protein HU200_053245 [Digitaria exilis]|uniref:FCP1 homology domain-containing protein n=1 Tax=Digitaria exilis TaxID=1010633 RepID=A0A835AJX3_9POAL|nr:hypothetical protein HU200_053245 [Digitaria exilis]